MISYHIISYYIYDAFMTRNQEIEEIKEYLTDTVPDTSRKNREDFSEVETVSKFYVFRAQSLQLRCSHPYLPFLSTKLLASEVRASYL